MSSSLNKILISYGLITTTMGLASSIFKIHYEERLGYISLESKYEYIILGLSAPFTPINFLLKYSK